MKTETKPKDIYRAMPTFQYAGWPRPLWSYIGFSQRVGADKDSLGTKLYWARHYGIHNADKYTHTIEDWHRLARLCARYSRFLQYKTEVEPAWEEVQRFSYIDGGIEINEKDRCGNIRHRVLIHI